MNKGANDMKVVKQRNSIEEFTEYWKDKGYEKGESQKFWLSLLRDVLGLEQPEKYINFEDKVHIDKTSFIDAYIPATKVLIEQKASNKDLRKKIRQSNGTYLTPYEQARQYIVDLPYSKHPRWVVTCNFKEFLIYDMEKPTDEPDELLLENLPKEYYRLSFLADAESIHIQKEKDLSIEAGRIVGSIYDSLYKQYHDAQNPETLKSLNKLCVRIVFCLYAEDAGIFGKHKMFHDYMAQFELKSWRDELIKLFKVLDTKIEDRAFMYLDDDLAAFPYVNGGLFADEDIEIPTITDEIRYMILTYGSEEFDWSQISPTIFGAIFESTLNPETRRKGGMHYTSIENIHKVIDPLFLDELKKEFESICEYKYAKVLDKKLHEFQDKISNLAFLDPACGSGNFLTESYLSLRKLENKVIQKFVSMNKTAGQIIFGDFEITNPIKVSISQFYGIEINDFAVTVARTALWIAEHQMMKETESIVHTNIDFLPLKTYANIIEGNALRIDWNSVVKKEKLNFIMGNPPFVGMKYQSADQKEDMVKLFGKTKNYGILDYVACWYYKAAMYIKRTEINVAFVSTNSITQGEQTAILWKPMLQDLNMQITFAYRTFRWDSEANLKAHVHCVIIGFTDRKNKVRKTIFFPNGTKKQVENITPYLVEGEDVFVEAASRPLCNVPKIIAGNKPVDGDFLKIEKEDYADFIKKEPNAQKYIKRLIGSYEFINNVDRYVLWLVGVSPKEIKEMPLVYERVNNVRKARLAMKDPGAIKLADTPSTFRDTFNPEYYIVIPIVSSERRRYVPMGFMDKNTIPTNQVQIIPNADIYNFGILTSNVHMAWMRAVCGRLKNDYRYTGTIVYNTFPWCKPTEEQRKKIEKTAKGILIARTLYPDNTLADLYDDVLMPQELRNAHRKNDIAVLEAYGLSKNISEPECVAELMKRYKEITE